MSDQKPKLEQIPNSVSGDGKNFVIQLKKFLQGFKDDTEKKIDGIGAGAVAQVFDLTLSETHTYDSKGNPINNIYVEFDNTNVTNYLNAQIWMKKSTENAYYMAGTTSNVTYTIPDVTAGVTYYVKVVACNTNSGTADFDDAPYDDITIQGSVLVPAAPTQFYLTFDDEGPLWEWQFVDNGYVDFFELRLDGLAGTWNANRLDSTRNNFSRAEPTVRSGTAYLFIRNIYGMYSQPATHVFNIAAPAKPNAPTLEMTLNGVVITMDALPSACYGYELEITDYQNNVENFETSNSQFVYYQFAGGVSVRYRFLDTAGHGEWSNATSGNMKSVLGLVELPEISYDKFDAATKTAIDQASTALTAVDSLEDQLTNLIMTQGEGTTSQFTALQSQVNTNQGNISTIISNLGVTPNGQNSYASINRLYADYDGLSSTVSSHTASIGTINTNITNITQNATSLSSTVQTLSNSVSTNASNITQTSSTLTAVVTALETSNPANVNSRWSAITALADGIDLCVKDTDLTGGSIINRINLSSTTTTIDGKYLHVTGSSVFDNSVIVGSSIADGAVVAAKIGSGAVTEAKLGTGAVTVNKIGSGAVTSVKLGSGAVTSDKIANGAVATAKIADGAISYVKIGDGAVIAEKIAANAVISAKIATNAITTDKINAGAITTGKLAANAVTAAKIAAQTITADQLATGSIIADKIAANAVTTAKLAAGSITAIKIASDAVEADKIKAGAVTAAKIASNAVTADKIKAGEVTAGKLAANAVTANNIAAGAVTAAKISVDNLQAVSANVGNLTGGTLTGTTLVGGTIRNANNTFSVSANGAITGATLTASTINGATINSGTLNADMITQAGFKIKSCVITSGTVSGHGGTIPLPSGYTEAQCLWTAYPPSGPDTHFSMNGRVVTCSYSYDEHGDWEGSSGQHYEGYYSVAYRVIGIK